MLVRAFPALLLAFACSRPEAPPPPPPPPAPPPEPPIEELAAAAHKAQAEGRIEPAHDLYGRIVRRDPKSRLGWQGFIDTLIIEGRYDEAVRQAQALELDPPDPVLRVLGAHAGATAHAYAGRLSEAEKAMRAHLVWAELQERRPWAIFAFSALIWLRWAQGDVQGAIDHVEFLLRFLDKARLDAQVKESWRLHALWDKAYLVSDRGDRKGARAAEREYATLAKKAGDEEGIPFLSAHLLLAERKPKEAAAALKGTDPQRLDMQDQWIVWRALKAGGDAAGAKEVEGRILSSVEPYLMHALVLREIKEARDRTKRR